MVDVQSEVKYWDPRRVGSDGSRRVPDVVCFHPHTGAPPADFEPEKFGAGAGLGSYTSISGWACVPDGAESECMH